MCLTSGYLRPNREYVDGLGLDSEKISGLRPGQESLPALSPKALKPKPRRSASLLGLLLAGATLSAQSFPVASLKTRFLIQCYVENAVLQCFLLPCHVSGCLKYML